MAADQPLDAMGRARLALDGLSVGDAFGERFFGSSAPARRARVVERKLPAAPWKYTDDTVMGLGVLEVLERFGRVDQDELAEIFARRYMADPARGYGSGAHHVLAAIDDGIRWHLASAALFDGTGSFGNGGAMRVAPIAGFFADDMARLVVEASRSAEVTHWHQEGQAGAIAVAVAGAFAWTHRGKDAASVRARLFGAVLLHTPESETRRKIILARDVDETDPLAFIALALGNGSEASSMDTVPFALWCAARHFDDYPAALWTAVEAGGDMDTMCAIVGGIVALSAVERGVPAEWIAARESLPEQHS
jgi:ADP-ribosylglycohydrolase